jgi:hypothetical protein
MYKEIKSINSNQVNSVIQLETNLNIPFDEANTDYQAYLKWLEEGNEPLPAES